MTRGEEQARTKWLSGNHEWLDSQGAWPTNMEEYTLAHFAILSVFVTLTALLDYVVQSVQRSLEPEDDRRVRRADFRRALGLIVWTRLQGELAVVGTLVVWIWLSHETGLLDHVAEYRHRGLEPASSRRSAAERPD